MSHRSTAPRMRMIAVSAILGVIAVASVAATPHRQRAKPEPEQMRHDARTSIHFSNIPVRSALQFIAEQGGFNLVVSDAVDGTISLRLVDVTWEQALDTVLRLKGLRLQVVDGLRRVAPVADR